MVSFSIPSSQVLSYESQSNGKLGNTNTLASNETLFNKTGSNSIEDPSTFVTFTKGFFTNSSASFIVETHKNVLFFRYGNNYSVFYTYRSSLDSVAYFPIQNNSNFFGLIVSYDKIDQASHTLRNYVKKYFHIQLIGDQGLSPVVSFPDDIFGENILGGVLIGNFNGSSSGPEVLVSYIELYTDQFSNEIAQSHILLLNLNGLGIIKNTWVDNAVFLNKNYYYNYNAGSNIIPAVESNFTSKSTRIDLFSFDNFSNSLFTSAWFSLNFNQIQLKTINNYYNNSYMLIKSKSQLNNFISLLTFQSNFTTFINNVTSLYEPQAINSSIILRSLTNGMICYLIQNDNKNIWETLNNTVLSINIQPPNTTWVYNDALNYNADNSSDLFLTSFTNTEISSFLIQDGSNVSRILANISLTNMQVVYLDPEFLIGSFSNQNNQLPLQEQQIIFIYKQNYYQILNNGTTDKVLVFTLPFSGTTIRYCNIGSYTLTWSINEYQLQSSDVYTQGFTYAVQNSQNLTLITNPNNIENIYSVNYVIAIQTTNGHQGYDFITLNFVPNECANPSFPIVSQNIDQNAFTGIKIPGLDIIISSIFIVSVLTLAIIYYIDHKRID